LEIIFWTHVEGLPMTDIDLKTYKFSSGLTYSESEALVDKLVAGYGDVPQETIIALLKNHLTRAVRDHRIEREIVAACAAS
jgi:hypothetical protein